MSKEMDMTIYDMMKKYKNNKTIMDRLEKTRQILVEAGVDHLTIRERRELRLEKLRNNEGNFIQG